MGLNISNLALFILSIIAVLSFFILIMYTLKKYLFTKKTNRRFIAMSTTSVMGIPIDVKYRNTYPSRKGKKRDIKLDLTKQLFFIWLIYTIILGLGYLIGFDFLLPSTDSIISFIIFALFLGLTLYHGWYYHWKPWIKKK